MITIFTIAHKRPDFIQIQYESIKKYVKGNYEFIVLNNAIDSKELKDKIASVCNDLSIKCIDVSLNEDMKISHGEINFTQSGYVNPNIACYYPINWLFKSYLTDEEKICLIDSDMFFINDIDLEKTVEKQDILYIPQYRDNNKVHYIWNAFVVFNFKRNPSLKTIDWFPGKVNGVPCDVGGQTHFDLLKINPVVENYIEEYSIYDIREQNQEVVIDYIQNGNINYCLKFKNDFIEVSHTGGEKLDLNRSFKHEKLNEEHGKYLIKRTLTILRIIEDKNLDLPDPKHIGFIGFANSDDYFIVHYKSGSNYLSFTTDEYNKKKTIAIKKLLGVNL